MCVICVLWEKGKLTDKEFLRAYREFAQERISSLEDAKHMLELEEKVKQIQQDNDSIDT